MEKNTGDLSLIHADDVLEPLNHIPMTCLYNIKTEDIDIGADNVLAGLAEG